MAAPVNDLFANALEVTLSGGEYLSPAILNTGATQEPFEDTIDGGDDASGMTCWWRFAPTDTIVATVDTSQSTGTSIDTALSVYSGTGSSDLVRIGFNDDEDPVFSSRLTDLTFVGGTTYWIRVDGWDPGITYRLHVSTGAATPPPAQGIGRVRVGSGENHTVYPVPAVPAHLASEPIGIMAQQFPHPILNGRGQPT